MSSHLEKLLLIPLFSAPIKTPNVSVNAPPPSWNHSHSMVCHVDGMTNGCIQRGPKLCTLRYIALTND